MPRIKRKLPSVGAEQVGVPFSPRAKSGFGEALQAVGIELLQVDKQLRDAEEIAEMERIKSDIDTTLATSEANIAQSPEVEMHSRFATATLEALSKRHRDAIKKLSAGNAARIEAYLLRKGTGFEIDVATTQTKVRKERIDAALLLRKDERLQIAKRTTDPDQLDAIIEGMEDHIAGLVASGHFKTNEATKEILEFEQNVLMESGLGQVETDVAAFRADFAGGKYDRLEKSKQFELLGRANTKDKDDRQFVKDWEQLIRKHAVAYLEQGAFIGELDVDYMNQQMKKQIITFEDTQRLKRINEARLLAEDGTGTEAIEQIRVEMLADLINARSREDATKIINSAAAAYKRLSEVGAYGYTGKSGKSQLGSAMAEALRLRRQDIMDVLRLITSEDVIPVGTAGINELLREPQVKKVLEGDTQGALDIYNTLKRGPQAPAKQTPRQRSNTLSEGIQKYHRNRR